MVSKYLAMLLFQHARFSSDFIKIKYVLIVAILVTNVKLESQSSNVYLNSYSHNQEFSETCGSPTGEIRGCELRYQLSKRLEVPVIFHLDKSISDEYGEIINRIIAASNNLYQLNNFPILLRLEEIYSKEQSNLEHEDHFSVSMELCDSFENNAEQFQRVSSSINPHAFHIFFVDRIYADVSDDKCRTFNGIAGTQGIVIVLDDDFLDITSEENELRSGSLLVHEIGHLLGLLHTFYSDMNTLNTECQSDFIYDTPQDDDNTDQSITCNFMDYNDISLAKFPSRVDCSFLFFSPCQKAKQLDVLYEYYDFLSFESNKSCYEQDLNEPNGSIYNTTRSFQPFSVIPLFGQRASGTIHAMHDEDGFELSILAPGRAQITLTNLTSDFDIAIYDSERRLIAQSNSISTSSDLLEWACISPGKYFLFVKNQKGNIQCSEYALSVDWFPGLQSCLNNSRVNRSSQKSNSCQNCSDITVDDVAFTQVFDLGVIDMQFSFKASVAEYYNIYALNEDNERVGTFESNLRVDPLNNPKIITIKGIPCGTTFTLKAEQNDDPIGCFFEEEYSVIDCETDNRQLELNWPISNGLCFRSGEVVAINWTSSNIDRINLYRCSSNNNCVPFAFSRINNGSLEWTVPEIDGNYFLRIEDAINDLISDDGPYFEIGAQCDINECDAVNAFLISPGPSKNFSPGLSITLEYSKQPLSSTCQFDEYEIWLSSSSQFLSDVRMRFTDRSSYNIGEMNEGTYYWRVRTVNDNGEVGFWSDTRAFQVNSSTGSYQVDEAKVCLFSEIAGELCDDNRSTFEQSQVAHATVRVSNILIPVRIVVVWRKGSTELSRAFSDWKSSGTIVYQSPSILYDQGSYNTQFFIETESGLNFYESRQYSVEENSPASTFGDLELVSASSPDIQNDVLSIKQGQRFELDLIGDYYGDLSLFLNRRLEPKVGVYLKRTKSSNIASGWYQYLGNEDFSFRCPSSTSICNDHWTDSTGDRVMIPYSIEPGMYYVVCFLDDEGIWNESNENNNVKFIPIEVLPDCKIIRNPIFFDNVTSSSVSISWEQNDNVDDSYIEYKKSTELTWNRTSLFARGSILRDLESCTRYNIRVGSDCFGGVISPLSNSSSVVTTCEFPCLPPSDRFESSLYNTAQLNWGFMEDVYLYELRYKMMGTNEWITESGFADCCMKYIEPLESGVEYIWQIRTVCGSEFSEWSSSRSIITLSLCDDDIRNGLETGIDCGGDCTPCNCSQEYHILDEVVASNDSIRVTKGILAESNIQEHARLGLNAGNVIILKPGFNSEKGSLLTVEIENCINE